MQFTQKFVVGSGSFAFVICLLILHQPLNIC